MNKKMLTAMNILFITAYCAWMLYCIYTKNIYLCVCVFFAFLLNETLYMLVWRYKELSAAGAVKFRIYYALIMLIALVHLLAGVRFLFAPMA